MPSRVWFPLAARKPVLVPDELTFLLDDYKMLRDAEAYIFRWQGWMEEPKQRNEEIERTKRRIEERKQRNEEANEKRTWPPSEPPFPQLRFQSLNREEILWADYNRSVDPICDKMREYLDDICQEDLPTPSMLEAMASEAIKGDREKRDKLVVSCLRYVIGFYTRSDNYAPPILGNEWITPIQEGNDTLFDVVDTYQPGHGLTFETYMSARIFFSAMDVSGDTVHSYFVFRDALWLREYRMTFRALSIQMGRDPSVSETLHTMILWMDEEGFDPYGMSKLDAVRCFLYDRERPENHSGAASLKEAAPCLEKGGCDGI